MLVALLELSVNCTVSGAHPDDGAAVNAATGGVANITVCVLLVLPHVLVVDKVTM
jgi:hypothetical protein